MNGNAGSEQSLSAAAKATPDPAAEPLPGPDLVAAAALLVSGLAGFSLARGRGRRLLKRANTPVVPPWSASDVATMILIHLACQVVAASLLLPQPNNPSYQWSEATNEMVAVTTATPAVTVVWQQLAAGILASTLTLAVAVPLLVFRSGGWGALLFASKRPGADVAAGLLMLLAITPPLLVLAGLLNRLVPYHHPILGYLASQQGPAALLLTLTSAVVVAPIVEEFFFRGVLQGWLERVAPAAAVPVSAAAFGLAHVDHGLGWIPLVGFGVAASLLTRRTGSLLASIVLHAGFNAVGVAAAMQHVQSAG
jgi:membrane protease YdiL (CAAX protease family)